MIWRMRIVCCITKGTNIDTVYVILITLPRQQWLHERASVPHYTYIVCFVHLICSACSGVVTVFFYVFTFHTFFPLSSLLFLCSLLSNCML